MDGVLVDSEPAITYAAMEVSRRLGYITETWEYKQYTGMGDDKFIGGVLEKHGGVYRSQYKDEAYQIYTETAKDKVKVYPWSAEIIGKLKALGYTLAVASASDIVKVKCNLDCIGNVTERLDAVVTGSDVERKKPAPDIFLKAAEKAGLEPRFCIVAEDAVAGIMAAKAAGMTAVGVTTSFPAEELKKAGADFVTDNLSELPEIAERIISRFAAEYGESCVK